MTSVASAATFRAVPGFRLSRFTGVNRHIEMQTELVRS